MDLDYYFNEAASLIGHDDAAVRSWLAAHPGYRGAIWINYGDGSDDVEVTDRFFPEVDDSFDELAAKQAAALVKLDATLEAMRAA